METRTPIKALIDADILRYEIGFASETGWRAITEDPEAIPPFDYVVNMLHDRIDYITHEAGATESSLYLTEGRTFRYDIAARKPYKAARIENKPWHFDNLTLYMRDVLGAEVITYIEADDALAMAGLADPDTVICSRDKDLRQVPAKVFSWELGRQPAFGPTEVTQVGSLSLSDDRKKLTGTGFAFFCSQLLTGDTADNIPGLPKCGPVKAYEILEPYIPDEADPIFQDEACYQILGAVISAYREYYNNHDGDWEAELLEQGRLCWMTRRMNPDGTPELWKIGQFK